MILSNVIYFAIIQYILFNLFYYLSSLILFFIDYNSCFVKYKIHNNVIDMSQIYKKVLPTVIFNTFIVPIPWFFILSFFINILNYQLTISKLLFDLITTPIIVDVLFYISHRLFHIPILYKYHKKHHEINIPIGISALYMTPVDLLFGNLLPTYLPLLIISAHPISILCWISFASVNTVIMAHSGFKWLAEYHDYHHTNSNKNFGVNIFMDRLFKTLY